MGYAICVHGKNGKKFYVKKLKKRVAETSSLLSEAMVFYSIQQLQQEYKKSQGESYQLDFTENYVTPYIIKV